MGSYAILNCVFQFKNNLGELQAALNSRYPDTSTDEFGLTDTEIALATQQLMSGTDAKIKKLPKPILCHLCEQQKLTVVKDGTIISNPIKDDLLALLLEWVSTFT